MVSNAWQPHPSPILKEPVNTSTPKGKIKRHYYFDIKAAMEAGDDLENVVVPSMKIGK